MRKKRNDNLISDISIIALDDDPLMTETLKSYFSTVGYEVDTENDPETAIELIRDKKYDIMLLDFLMSPICGDVVVRRVRAFDPNICIILLTGHKSLAPPIKTIRELDIQGYYEKSDRFDQLELLIESCVKAIRQNRTIRQYRDELKTKNDALSRSYADIIKTLRSVVDARDEDTRGHSDRVAYYAECIAIKQERDEDFIRRVHIAGIFHDVGKIGVPDDILLKPGRLTDDEFSKIKEHTSRGREILSELSQFDAITPIVAAHHERMDGHGYPRGLSREEIPEEARIISVADAFDAMTSHRRYRNDLTLEQAIEQLERGRGSQFDEKAADSFIQLLKEDPGIVEKARDAADKKEEM